MINIPREIVAILDAPEISLSEYENAGDSIIKFYKALGWNSDSEFLNPSKIRTTKEIYNRLYDITYAKCPDPVAVGMLMVNQGPGVDEDIPQGKVYLLKGWVLPNESIHSDDQ